jgi:hypothetical protein
LELTDPPALIEPPSLPIIPCLIITSPSASRRHLPTLPFISMSPAALMEKPSSTVPRTMTVPRKRMFPVCGSTSPFTSYMGSTLIFSFATTTWPLIVAMTLMPSAESSVFFPGFRGVSLPGFASRGLLVMVLPGLPSVAGDLVARS